MPTDELSIKEIEIDIYNILKDICEQKRKITPDEKKRYSKYLKDYFEYSLDKHGETFQMTKIVFWTIHLANSLAGYNVVATKQPKENLEFFENEFQEKGVLEKYVVKVNKILNKMISEEIITPEEFEQYDEIFYELSYITDQDDNDSIEIMKVLEKKSKELKVVSKTIENRIERYIQEGLEKKEYFSKPKEFMDIIIKYFETQLKGTAIEINQNSAISHLIRGAQKGKLPQDISTLILNKLEERKRKSPILEMDNTEDIESYMTKVAEMRLQQGRMSRECSDYILKLSILEQASGKSEEVSKYNGMIERALEDFTEYELEDSKLNDYYVAVLNQQYLPYNITEFTVAGSISQESKKIKLSRENLLRLGTLELLAHTLHECTHAEQYTKITSGKHNRDSYKMLKELILRQTNIQFGYSNYWYMYEEIDARKNGYIKRIRTLKKMGLNNIIIYLLGAGNRKQAIKNYNQDYKLAKFKRVGEDKKDLNAIFLELLQQQPELLEKYPELNMEFEKKGDSIQKKSLANILNSYEQSITEVSSLREIQRISSWFSEMLLNVGEMTEERMQEELQQLISFKSDNKIIKAYKEKMLMTIFPRQMVLEATAKEFYNNTTPQERIDVQDEIKEFLGNNVRKKQHEDIEID